MRFRRTSRRWNTPAARRCPSWPGRRRPGARRARRGGADRRAGCRARAHTERRRSRRRPWRRIRCGTRWNCRSRARPSGRDVPVFAICRGIQALNVALGGTLIRTWTSSGTGRQAWSHQQRQSQPEAPLHAALHEIDDCAGTRLREIAGADTPRGEHVPPSGHQGGRPGAGRHRVAARSRRGTDAVDRGGRGAAAPVRRGRAVAPGAHVAAGPDVRAVVPGVGARGREAVRGGAPSSPAGGAGSPQLASRVTAHWLSAAGAGHPRQRAGEPAPGGGGGRGSRRAGALPGGRPGSGALSSLLGKAAAGHSPGGVRGGADTFRLDEREVAVTCGSHSAEPDHLAAVRSILDKAGLDEGALQCGVQPPLDAAQAAALARAGRDPHGAPQQLLGQACGDARDVPGARVAGGHVPGAGPSRAAGDRRASWASSAGCPAGMAAGTDGCGVPTFRLTVAQTALAFARLADPSDAGVAAVRRGGASDARDDRASEHGGRHRPLEHGADGGVPRPARREGGRRGRVRDRPHRTRVGDRGEDRGRESAAVWEP